MTSVLFFLLFALSGTLMLIFHALSKFFKFKDEGMVTFEEEEKGRKKQQWRAERRSAATSSLLFARLSVSVRWWIIECAAWARERERGLARVLDSVMRTCPRTEIISKLLFFCLFQFWSSSVALPLVERPCSEGLWAEACSILLLICTKIYSDRINSPTIHSNRT